MIKCFFVDVKSISSDLPRSNFTEPDLDRLADLILETDGLLRPLVLKQVGIEQYTVIEGHREYYAALKAKEKNLKKAEMVNAFVINDKSERSAIEQLKLLVENRPSISDENNSLDRERDYPNDLLLPAISSLISERLQPLYQELAEQKRMFVAMTEKNTIDRLADRQIILEHITKTSESIGSKLANDKSTKPKKIDIALAKMLASIEPAKLTNSLHLINTLSQLDLSSRMKRSAISKSEILATNIFDARLNREDSKFDSWESVVSSVSGLGGKTTRTIIEKLG
jgi:ParB-like nuclease domain